MRTTHRIHGKCFTYEYSFIIKDTIQEKLNIRSKYEKVWQGPGQGASTPSFYRVREVCLQEAHQCVHQPKSYTKPQCPESLLEIHFGITN